MHLYEHVCDYVYFPAKKWGCDELINGIDLFLFTRHPVTVVDSAKQKLLRAFRRRQSSSPASLLFLDPRGLRFFLCFQVTAGECPFYFRKPGFGSQKPLFFVIPVVPWSTLNKHGISSCHGHSTIRDSST